MIGKGELTARWGGTVLQVGGAILLATRLASPVAAYAVMLVGAVIWAVIAGKRRDWALTSMMVAYAVINIVGIVTWQRL